MYVNGVDIRIGLRSLGGAPTVPPLSSSPRASPGMHQGTRQTTLAGAPPATERGRLNLFRVGGATLCDITRSIRLNVASNVPTRVRLSAHDHVTPDLGDILFPHTRRGRMCANAVAMRIKWRHHNRMVSYPRGSPGKERGVSDGLRLQNATYDDTTRGTSWWSDVCRGCMQQERLVWLATAHTLHTVDGGSELRGMLPPSPPPT